jgi:hypothetical protein
MFYERSIEVSNLNNAEALFMGLTDNRTKMIEVNVVLYDDMMTDP